MIRGSNEVILITSAVVVLVIGLMFYKMFKNESNKMKVLRGKYNGK